MKNILLVGVSLFAFNSLALAGVPSSFTYEGKLMNAAGTAPLSAIIGLKLEIYDPTGSCLLYSENQSNIDLTQTNGLFSVQVGSAVADSTKRTSSDQGLAMSAVFANNGQVLAASTPNCSAGYTPTAGEGRILRVTVTNGASVTILSPDLKIGSVPNSMVSETLQGMSLSQVMEPAGTLISFTGANCPSGYLASDGASYSATAYPNLANVYKNGAAYSYGGTVASGNFNVPNANGLFIRGSGSQVLNGVTYTAGALGSTQQDQIQGHNHSLSDPGHSHYRNANGRNELTNVYPNGGTSGVSSAYVGGNQTDYYQFTANATTNITITGPSNGANGAVRSGDETRPANLTVKYCIKY